MRQGQVCQKAQLGPSKNQLGHAKVPSRFNPATHASVLYSSSTSVDHPMLVHRSEQTLKIDAWVQFWWNNVSQTLGVSRALGLIQFTNATGYRTTLPNNSYLHQWQNLLLGSLSRDRHEHANVFPHDYTRMLEHAHRRGAAPRQPLPQNRRLVDRFCDMNRITRHCMVQETGP